jgi:transposase-like protein
LCPGCGRRMGIRYENRRTVATLQGLVRLRLKIRRCEEVACARHRRPYRPEGEGAIVLPQHEFGLDVMALVGALRYREHRSVPEIHRLLLERGVAVCERTVTNLLDRYDELVATVLDEPRRVALVAQQRVILAIDGLQPDVGHEVLWVIRDCLSGQVLLARSLLSATASDLAALLGEVVSATDVPVAGMVSDRQHSIRLAVQQALPDVPHQLCHFHYLREAARPIFDADRHAKKELKKQLRGIRPIERQMEGGEDTQAQAVRGYCAAVRSALTDDGRPPLAASGLKLHGRLEAIAGSLRRVEEKGA